MRSFDVCKRCPYFHYFERGDDMYDIVGFDEEDEDVMCGCQFDRFDYMKQRTGSNLYTTVKRYEGLGVNKNCEMKLEQVVVAQNKY